MVYIDNGIVHKGHRPRNSSDYKREPTKFRSTLEPLAPGDVPEKGRYHLIVCAACPWAHRTVLMRTLKKLEDHLSLSVVSPFRDDDVGWAFYDKQVDEKYNQEFMAPTPDKASGKGFKYLYELYLHCEPKYTGNVTTPVLYDSKENKIVSNESWDIVRMLDGWITLPDAPSEDIGQFYPIDPQVRSTVDRVSEEVQQALNNGVYRAGLAKSQDAYNDAVSGVFDCLARLEDQLQESRYLVPGLDHTTVADWQLFPTLVRFDAVYHPLFKCTKARLSSFHNLTHYLRELYQMPGIANTVSMQQNRDHYFTTFTSLNPNKIVVLGNDESLSAPSNRAERFNARAEMLEMLKLEGNKVATEEEQGKSKEEKKKKGEFVRGASGHRQIITEDGKDGTLRAEKGRYHLYIANNCPWCHRVMLARAILGLQDVISVDVCFYRRHPDNGWQFLPADDELRPDELANKDTLLANVAKKDSVFGKHYIPEIYKLEGSSEKSVPVLFDKVTKTIVNNESAEIIRIFNSGFRMFHRKGAPNLYPMELQADIERLNADIYPNINNGAYKSGFTSNQEAYEKAFESYFDALDRINNLLRDKRFLTGNSVTEADVRLLPTIIRHDPVYFVRMRLNKFMIKDYPHLDRWLREMWGLPGVVEATDIQHCIRGYFGRTGNNLIPASTDGTWY